MSTINIFQFPVLTDSLFLKLGYLLSKTEFSYKDVNGVHLLKSEDEIGANTRVTIVRVNDESGKWHPDSNNLNIRISGEIENPFFLFGPKGLLPSENSTMGIGVIWTDKEARIRGSVPVTSIESSVKEPVQFEKTVHFDAGELRGLLSVKIVLYVIQSTGRDSEGRCYARTEGTVLGILDDQKIIIEGSGSVFPITETEEPGEPLWWISAAIDDPNTDRFDEDHFTLNLNKAHKNFPDLHTEDGEDSYLLKEVLASAIFTLISLVQKVEGGDEAIRIASQAQPGSMGKIINYMLKTNGWLKALDNPEELNRQIHSWVERKV